MNLKLKATVLMACLGAAVATDGGCLEVRPKLAERGACTCDPNPNGGTFVACKDNDIQYIDDLSNLKNGYSICFVNGKKESISMTTCSIGDDCLPSLQCHEGFCVDDNGVREMNRLSTSCVSPKLTDAGDDRAGCPEHKYPPSLKLECHKYWIEREGAHWRQYLQYNPLGKGDSYAWAYDEQVCATSGHTLNKPSEEYCTDKNSEGSAVDSLGKVIDSTCPCTVDNSKHNSINAVSPFLGYGKHMYLHIYELMHPGYVKPTKRNDFTSTDLPHVAAEDDKVYLKIVNEYPEEILVYFTVPPARKNEHVSGPSFGPKFQGWTGPKKTTRGSVQQAQEKVENVDAWVSRITMAPNNNPSASSQPTMRVESPSKNTARQPTGPNLGGFYVPKGYHLRIQLGDQDGGGWCTTKSSCPDTTCSCDGVNMWFTRGDAYNKGESDLVFLFEPNINPWKNPFYFDLSAVEAVNANAEIIYGTVDNMVAVPLFQSEDGLLSAEPDFNTESLTSLQ
mmetsp:Transcript_38172/g.42763  ORF Transcript_38172/g.42763 Transcript_38172/m.42763 type:complete len:506 (+) Transcript_38172:390-1907(+)